MYCQLETLRHCLPPSVRGVLNELPETLDETYERVLRDINKANREHALRLLHCLTVSMRPLRVEELAEVLAVDFDAARQGGIPKLNLDWRWADQHQAVLSTCSSLISIVDDGGSQVVQFSHFSVKEFLTSDRLARSSEDVSRYHILLEPAHTLLAQACLGVLFRLDDTFDKWDANDIPLAEYAARYWVDHARFEDVSSCISEAMELFFDVDKPHWTTWNRVQKIDVSWEWYSPYPEIEGAFPLYYASLCGFYNVVEHLITKYPDHINATGGLLVAPLVAALYGQHFDVAELLFRHGADVDVRGIWDNTPLTTACSTGPFDTVMWLLNHGANMNSHREGRWTSLHFAASYGYLKSVQALLERGADINARNDYGEVPLHRAASPFNPDHRDQLAIMQLLLDYGADANAQDNEGSTPLHHSSIRQRSYDRRTGTVEGTRLLLKYGADIDAKDNEDRTSLQLALANGRDEIARFLSDYGATG